MEYDLAPDFEKCRLHYRLDEQEWKRVQKALRLFEANHRHPSLRSAKLEGYAGFYYIRGSDSLRLVYRLPAGGSRARFFWVGRHGHFDRQF